MMGGDGQEAREGSTLMTRDGIDKALTGADVRSYL